METYPRVDDKEDQEVKIEDEDQSMVKQSNQ
jgi:hypothetical protein